MLKTAQAALPRRPKWGPRFTEEAPKPVQERLKTASYTPQEAPGSAHKGRKSGQEPPKTAQYRP